MSSQIYVCPGCGAKRQARKRGARCQSCKPKKITLTPDQVQWAIEEARRIRFQEERDAS